jgi:FHS family Na+ dependent glucose MFS transporter 1
MTDLTTGQNGKLKITIGYFFAIIAFGTLSAVWGPALPSLANQTHSDLSQISIIFTFNALGFLLGSSLGGRIYDRVPGHPMMVGGLAVMMVTAAAIPLISQLWLLVLVIFLLGAAIGLMVVGANTLLVWVHQANMGPWMNTLTLCNGIGGLLSPMIISSVLAASGKVNIAFWILGAYILLPLVWNLSTPSPPIPSDGGDEGNTRINYRLVIPVALIFLLATGTEISYHGWFYTMVTTIHSGVEITAGYMLSAYWGAVTFGRLLSIFLITRFSPRALLIASFSAGLVSAGFILAGSSYLPALWVGAVGMGLSLSSIFPILLTFTERRARITGKMTGIFFSSGAVGSMTLPWLSGQLFRVVGPRAPMIVVLASIIAGVAIFTYLMLTSQRKTGQTVPDPG